jgi:hypothetical protein
MWAAQDNLGDVNPDDVDCSSVAQQELRRGTVFLLNFPEDHLLHSDNILSLVIAILGDGPGIRGAELTFDRIRCGFVLL